MAQTAFLVILATLPVAALAAVFFYEDRHEPEPPANLARYFTFGLCCYVLAMLVHAGTRGWRAALHLDATPAGGLLAATVFVGVTEELLKFGAFWLAARRDRELDEPYDGCIYAAFAALGFALAENLAYVLSEPELRKALGIAALRCATAVPAHALFGAIWGLAFGVARFRRRYRPWLPLAIGLAIVVHGTYDFVADWSARRGNHLIGYFALLAQLAVLTFAVIEGIHLAHRHSPHRPRD